MVKLADCESGINSKAVNPNDRGSPSYGLFQYKKLTWQFFSKKYNFKGDIMSGIDQWQLTKMVLSDNFNKNVWHWKNCYLTIKRSENKNILTYNNGQ